MMLDRIALIFTIIGALNWGGIGLFGFDTVAFFFGIPTSESHALIAGLTGSAIALHSSFEGVNGGEWIKVVYGIGISVGLGFGLGWLVCKLVTALFRKANRPKTEPFFRGAQIVGAASMAFMHGAQDGQKFMGVVLLCVYMSQGQSLPSDIHIPIWLMIVCSVVMAAGTAMRFLTAYCAQLEGQTVILDGIERMHHRPIGQLVDALREIGADIEYLSKEGFPPLKIKGCILDKHRIVTINNPQSTQFVSALLLIGANVHTDSTSPYITLTREMIKQWGDAAEYTSPLIGGVGGGFIRTVYQRIAS